MERRLRFELSLSSRDNIGTSHIGIDCREYFYITATVLHVDAVEKYMHTYIHTSVYIVIITYMYVVGFVCVCVCVQVKIWDTAGSEKYMSISAVYYR